MEEQFENKPKTQLYHYKTKQIKGKKHKNI